MSEHGAGSKLECRFAVHPPDTFRPGSGRESLQVIRCMIAEVEGRERAVRDTYRRHLPRLQAASVR
jgi:hypothetical protein